MVYVCLTSLTLSEDDFLYLSLELQILNLENGSGSTAIFGLPLFLAFPESLDLQNFLLVHLNHPSI